MSSIKNILRTHEEWLLVLAGLAMVLVIGWMLVWGVASIAGNVGASLGEAQGNAAAERFNVEAISETDFRGLD